MVLSKDGIERIRDLTYDDMSDGAQGTDGTESSEADTALGAEIVATNATLTLSKFTKGITIEHEVDIATGNSEDYREFGVENAANLLFMRMVYPTFSKTATDSMDTNVQLLFIQREV